MSDAFRAWEDSGLPPDSPGTVVTVGTFDGLHRGHYDVLTRIARRATAAGLHSVLVTFDRHPLEVIDPARAPRLLTPGAEKSELIAQTGVGYMAIVPFTERLRQFSASDFVDEVLRRRFHMRELVIGYDHHFGRGREGGAATLARLGEDRGFAVDIVPAVSADGTRPVSSSMIRRAVVAGALHEASSLLGRPYALLGTVRAGAGRGRALGFPTINLGAPHPRKLLPPAGVYAVRVQARAGWFGGMMNLGPRPTFGDGATSVEVHLFDADVELYGAAVKVEFVARLRDVTRFAGPEALAAQLREDERQARRALTLAGETSNLHVSPRTTLTYPQS